MTGLKNFHCFSDKYRQSSIILIYSLEHLAAVYCSASIARSGEVKIGLGMMSKLGRAWVMGVSAWVVAGGRCMGILM